MPVCSHCNRDAESHRTITCCICAKIFKIDCVDISNAEARKIRANTGLTWSCSSCKQFGQDMNSLKSVIVATTPTFAPSVPSLIDMEKVIQELTERDKRKHNIIIYGCKESNCTSNREQHDLDAPVVSEIMSVLEAGNLDIKPSRLGKFDNTQGDRCRPIKLRLPSESAVSSVLRNAKKLTTHARFNSVSISRDRTPMQLSLHREMKAKLNERLANGESNLRIVYKRGVPHIISTENYQRPTAHPQH